MWNAYAAHGSVTVPDGVLGGISVSASKPTDQTRPWLQLDSMGRPVRLYWFAQGSWLSLHPLPPGSTIWWFDILPTFAVFDGGDSNPPSPTTGPMWQQAKLPNGTVIAAQFPLVAGTLSSGTVLAVGDVGGEEKHLLTIPELPAHHHEQMCADPAGDAIGGGGANRRTLGSTASTFIGSGLNTGDMGSDQAHNNMGPYVVGYLLQRTPQRLYYSIT